MLYYRRLFALELVEHFIENDHKEHNETHDLKLVHCVAEGDKRDQNREALPDSSHFGQTRGAELEDVIVNEIDSGSLYNEVEQQVRKDTWVRSDKAQGLQSFALEKAIQEGENKTPEVGRLQKRQEGQFVVLLHDVLVMVDKAVEDQRENAEHDAAELGAHALVGISHVEDKDSEGHQRGQDESLGADVLVALGFEQYHADNDGKEFRRADKNLDGVVEVHGDLDGGLERESDEYAGNAG